MRSEQKQDWTAAAQFFEQAREQAPDAPQILFQLGTAELKMGGRELRAMAWFEAYLAASPQAAHRAAVEQQVASLEPKIDQEIAQIIAAMHPLGAFARDQSDENFLLGKIVDAQVAAGDYPGALKTTARIKDNHAMSARTPEIISKAQLRRGDITGALQTVAQIQDPSEKAAEYCAIAAERVKRGDIAGAKQSETLALQAVAGAKETKDHSRADVAAERFKRIAAERAKRGDIAGAKRFEALAAQFRPEAVLEQSKNGSYAGIATEQAQRGDFAAALQSAALISRSYLRRHVYLSIAIRQAKHGNVVAALKTAQLIQNAPTTCADPLVQIADQENQVLVSAAYSAIAEAQAKQGNIAAAKQSEALALEAASKAPDLYAWIAAYGTLVQEQAKRGDFPAAFETAKALQDTVRAGFEKEPEALKALEKSGELTAKEYQDYMRENKALVPAIDFVEAAAGQGDFAAALQSAENIPDKDIRRDLITAIAASEDFYEKIARQQARHGDFAGALQTAGQIAHAEVKSDAYTAIAGEQAKRGDAAGARRAEALALAAAQEIREARGMGIEYSVIAREQAERGDPLAALKTAALISDPSLFPADDLIKTYAEIADAQAKRGDIAGARQTLALALAAVVKTTDAGSEDRLDACYEIAEHLASMNAFAGAFASLETAAFTGLLYTDFANYLRTWSEASNRWLAANNILNSAKTLAEALADAKALAAEIPNH